ncbi:sigma-70 family RNA polymerase sigma factor [Novosphingobium sp. ST904]|uniref:RNA polymerase sigma factor n=1 Tax=Novosphingobium sp. ST904 TaxID=1684385 RepID=UPI0006CD05CB|nr:sigma-70 family RNA polymerase sigma factor [Novosphingobium sp. ST904]KPH59543.1 RNA polymerase subunit sigma-24 [Novosphingobium sp. ST904]TCM37985.1 RNA polymerase sigma-70 factor (ECF subfamily) [Novosphingobium sp. ST904]
MTSLGQEVPADGGLRQVCLAMRGELRRFLLARRVSEADVEDLLQDLFLRLETTVTGPVRAPRAYLYQMVNNMAHTRRRTETRRQSRDAGWIDARDGEEQADAAPDAEATLVARDQLARVEARLAQLPERTAYVFRQFRIEGASQKEIAGHLGISLSAVEKHLQRAYRAVLEIRARLDDAAGGAGRTGGFDDSSR